MGTSKTFKPWEVDQACLFPASVRDFVPADHPAFVVRELVRNELDLSAIHDRYSELRGFPPYHPTMMTALLLYALCRGVYSSRRIEASCEERVDFMAVPGKAAPDHSTICKFRNDHREALTGLFVQVLSLCRDAGLVKLGHVALDGTKVQANASKHSAMSYKRMKGSPAPLVEAAMAGSGPDRGVGCRSRGFRGDRLMRRTRTPDSGCSESSSSTPSCALQLYSESSWPSSNSSSAGSTSRPRGWLWR